MNKTSPSNEKLSVSEHFKLMNVSPGMDYNSLALSWLQKHNKTFIGFADGHLLPAEALENDTSETRLHKITDQFTGEHLYDVYALCSADLLAYDSNSESSNIKTWTSKSAADLRSKTLYNVAKTIEKYQNLLSAVESISSGKHLSKVKTRDIPNLIESFYYYSGCALQLQEKSKAEVWFPIGHVFVITDEYNNLSLPLSLQVSSLLAAGNCVTVLVDKQSCLSAFLLAEICNEAGIPAGVLNVFPIEYKMAPTLKLPNISKILCTSSFFLESQFSSEISSSIPSDILIPRRPIVVVYKDADLHAAAEGVIEAFCYHDTRSKSGGCKLMVQQSIAETFLKILGERFSKILVGSNLSKTDMSCIVTKDQKKKLTECIEEAEKHAKILKLDVKTLNYTHLLPTLISDIETGFKLVHEELGGPIIVAVTFRTEKESISMFNCDNKGSPVSIWTDKISVALEVAHMLKTGTVWVNSQNVISAKAAFSGVYSSGNSVEGGISAFYSNLRTDANDRLEDSDSKKADQLLGSPVLPMQNICNDMTEYKLFIGGTQKRSDKVLIKGNTIIPYGSEADILSAITSAGAAQPKWEIYTKHQRRQVMLSVLENLKKKREAFAIELEKITKLSLDECNKEVSDALDILYYWAFQIDHNGGEMEEISRSKVLQNRNPLGIIGIQCPDEKPLLSLLSLLAPAVLFGNAVVILASEQYPTPALKMCEIFSLSGIPSGVINVINGPKDKLFSCLLKNQDVNAVWYTDISIKVGHPYNHITQRVICCNDIWKNFNEAKSLKCVMASTFIKSIFIPCGEIFAN